jgi:hypothetical protein
MTAPGLNPPLAMSDSMRDINCRTKFALLEFII